MTEPKTANDLDNLENIIDDTEPTQFQDEEENGIEFAVDSTEQEQEPNEEEYESEYVESDNESQIGGDPEDGMDEEMKGSNLGFETEEEEEEEEEEFEEENYQKFDDGTRENYIIANHPEIIQHNNEEIAVLSKVVRNSNGIIIDPLHRTLPFITKYERAKILGSRAKQINRDAPVFVNVPDGVIDGYTIALLEYKEKAIPFIIRRPIPNGGCEYWRFEDLEQIDF